MDGEQAPNRLIINLGKLRDFLTKCLLCVAAAWNLCFRCCQESGEDEPSENYNKDKFSQECGEYLDRFCHWRTLRERRFKFLQLIYRFFHRRNSEEENENENKRESETENNQPVQNETGVIHDMGLRLRIRKGEQASESRPSTGVMVDHSGCDAEADGLSQGSNTPAASTTDAAVTPPSNSSSVPPLLDDDDDDADGERAILGTSVMPSPKTRPTETTSPLTPINKSATSALAVLDQNNSPSQLIKPPASQPTSDSCSSFSPTMHVPTSNTSPHLDSPVHSTASVATECLR
ncbi:uncharacterized protein LOC124278574 isoform X2 [Haliotis rubra]|nr:uncharacterized protein LOC124278574 isoform X2 [Haliotis rubra]XP_046570284.1 uncharacterized protein LOC124278574 isoform X2 [Haliotis rubra]